MIVRQVTLLPEPDSPTIPRVSPRSRVNETPSTAVHDAVVRLEARPQVLDLEQRHQLSRILGSTRA